VPADRAIPTFCRGWARSRSTAAARDLTAHAVRAWAAWVDRLEPPLRGRVDRALDRSVVYLRTKQRVDGAFLPLWFGNEGKRFSNEARTRNLQRSQPAPEGRKRRARWGTLPCAADRDRQRRSPRGVRHADL